MNTRRLYKYKWYKYTYTLLDLVCAKLQITHKLSLHLSATQNWILETNRKRVKGRKIKFFLQSQEIKFMLTALKPGQHRSSSKGSDWNFKKNPTHRLERIDLDADDNDDVWWLWWFCLSNVQRKSTNTQQRPQLRFFKQALSSWKEQNSSQALLALATCPLLEHDSGAGRLLLR